MEERESTGRIAVVDGLRGVAVAMVVLFHTWFHATPFAWLRETHPRTPIDHIVGQWSQGVSLFLVLSGFCLAYPSLRRHVTRGGRWFVPSAFFARRVLRILPPYYAAFALFVAANALKARLGWSVVGGAATQGLPDVASHLALVHNLTRYRYDVNGSF